MAGCLHDRTQRPTARRATKHQRDDSYGRESWRLREEKVDATWDANTLARPTTRPRLRHRLERLWSKKSYRTLRQNFF